MARVRIGQMLKQRGLVDEHQIATAVEFQRRWGVRMGQALLRLQLLAEADLLAALGEQLGVPVAHLGDVAVEPEVLRRLPERTRRVHRALPLRVVSVRGAKRLIVAFADPTDLTALDEVAFAAGMEIVPVLAGEEDLDRAAARQRVGRAVPGDLDVELPPAPSEPMQLVDGRTVRS